MRIDANVRGVRAYQLTQTLFADFAGRANGCRVAAVTSTARTALATRAVVRAAIVGSPSSARVATSLWPAHVSSPSEPEARAIVRATAVARRAIRGGRAAPAMWAARTIGAAAVDIGFIAISHLVRAMVIRRFTNARPTSRAGLART